MGMDPFNFGDSLLGVLAQRLVRRLCPHCHTERPMTEEESVELLTDYLHAFPEGQAPSAESLLADWIERFGKDGVLMHHDSPGCDRCGGTGFRGRAGIHELMLVGKEIKHLIQTGTRAEQIQVVAMREGMRTLRQDGIEKVLLGVTNIAEVRASSNS
jgi:type II secretory ATPase GspE/PulE/Tfp pilus assembly ATPase PilB-like protein